MFYFISSRLLTGFWFLLSDGDITSLLVGVVFIPMSVYVSAKLSEKTDLANRAFYINIAKIPKFIWFFLYQFIKGGTDTAVRLFSFDIKLQPEFIHYPIKHLPAGSPMNLFMNEVSLLPGSVSLIREPTSVLVHVLAVTKSSLEYIYECELAICELYSLDIYSQCHVSSTRKVS
ncbi:Na+/H+ antiporter subunit E [Colwellia sp. MB02u-14]|uniref:Na+/H+ antiporter subunit E n=1 Tax=Colwellia sp. MB02u-14 TaxID=2759815 RepID=UPI0015F64E3D|nr:Na+/H+ antiporter subunit E [Colwellia sp. MB02u-14]MBA6302834.1 Na+/H+ antiporter subunit E [Colwellia sp. MB02u-14]